MIEWFLIVLMLLLSGFFSGTEMAYVSANRLKLEIRARKNNPGARHLGYLLRNPDSFLSTTLVGNNVANVIYATLVTIFFTGTVNEWYNTLAGSYPSTAVLLVIQTAIISFFVLVFGEVLPKVIFRAYPDILISILGTPFRVLGIMLSPLVTIATKSSGFVVGFIQKEAIAVEEFFKRLDFELLFKEMNGDSSGDLDKEDSEILTNVLELQHVRVRDSMIPRTEIVAVEKDATIKEALQLFISSGFSKLPVYEDNLDNIVGVIIAYDLFKDPETLDEIIRPIKHVPSSQRSKALMTEFKAQNISMAIVIDEYGGTAGLVTIEDLIEEVVGDIQDEHDEEENFIKKLNANTWLISGSYEIEDIVEEYPQIQLPVEEADYETIAGYIIHNCGRIPKLNEEIVIDQHKFIITKSTRTRIEVVKLIISN